MILSSQPTPKSTEEKLAEALARINALEKATGKTVYPEATGQHYSLNEGDRPKSKGKPPKKKDEPPGELPEKPSQQ